MQDQLQAINDSLARRDFKKAEILIARSLRTDLTAEQRAIVLLRRARTRLLGARPEDALEDLQTARSLDNSLDDDPQVIELTGDCYFAHFELASVGFADRSDTGQALECYEYILENHPNYDNIGWVHYQRGRVLLTENRVDEAVACFQDALLNPGDHPALTSYSYERLGFVALYETRDLKRALAFLNKAVNTYPTGEDRLWLVQVQTLRSRVLREMREFDAALGAIETAIEVASSSSEGRVGLSDTLLAAGEILTELSGREKDIIARLQQFLQISKKPLGVDVTWSRVYEMLGDAYYRLGQHALAASSYQTALQFNPYHPWELSLYYRMARSYYQFGEYEKAMRAIQQMMQVAEADGQPISDYRVYNVLGNAQFALGHYDDALQAYQRSLEIAPANADNLDSIRQYYQYAQELSRST